MGGHSDAASADAAAPDGGRDGSEVGAAYDALDLGPDQPLDQRRQIGVQPLLEQRAEFFAHRYPRCVGPPPMDLRRALGGQRPQQRADRGGGGGRRAAGATSRTCAARMPPARPRACATRAAAGASVSGGLGRGAGCGSSTIMGDRGRARPSSAAARPRFRRGAFGAGRGGGASSSLRMRRIEARMSSIEGSPPAEAAGRALSVVCDGRSCSRYALTGRAGRWRSRRCRPTCSRTAL